MTPQEQSMIDDLVARIRSTPVADKDLEAERHLQQTLGNVPDALYVLTQTVLVQQYGLEQAQAQLRARQEEIDALKREQEASSHNQQKGGGSFLSRIFGSDEGSTQTPSPNSPMNTTAGYQPVNYAPPAQGGYPPPPAYSGQPYAGGSYGGPAYGVGSGISGGGGFGGGGFLRGALQTAAGVAAGAMVFQGMEDLFHGFGGHESRGLGSMPGETVVNNYYGDEGERGSTHDLAGGADSGFYNPAHDASRDNPESGSRGFADTGSDYASNDDDDSATGFDDSSDFSDSDDSGSFDGDDDSNY